VTEALSKLVEERIEFLESYGPGHFLADSAEKTYAMLVTHQTQLSAWKDFFEILEGDWDLIEEDDEE